MVCDVRQFLAVECGDVDGERHRQDRNVQVMCQVRIDEITFGSGVQKGVTFVRVILPPQFHRKEGR